MHDNGTFTPASAVPAPPAVLTDPVDLAPPAFATVRKGYEPAAVDAHLALLAESLSTLRAALADSERRRAMAEQHAVAVEEEIRVVRAGRARPTPASARGPSGCCASPRPRPSRSASTAHRTAAEVTERAQGEAERHRHDVRQQLIAESARSEEQAARRASELQDREGAFVNGSPACAPRRTRCAWRPSGPPMPTAQAPRPTSRSSAAGPPRSSAGPARRPSASWPGSAICRASPAPSSPRGDDDPGRAGVAGRPVVPAARPSPRPTRRIETPAVDGPPPGRARHSDGEPPSDDTTPHRYAAAGR